MDSMHLKSALLAGAALLLSFPAAAQALSSDHAMRLIVLRIGQCASTGAAKS